MKKRTIGPCTIFNGDCLDIIPNIHEVFDAVITDPPYCSGAGTLYGKSASPSVKYQQSKTDKVYPTFQGDAKDQIAWAIWMRSVLSLAKRLSKDGAYFLTFTDWRQLSAAITAIQFADISFRGIITWDKGASARAPHKGYFRQQAEFVVWGANGKPEIAEHGGPWPGVIRHPVNPLKKLHITAKPVEVMEELVQCVPPGGLVFDPFMGSASTAIACIRTGRRFVGVETSAEYFEISEKRILDAIAERNQP